MNLIKDFLRFLQNINENYANVLLLIVAVISALYAYREFEIKQRPYVVPEISHELINGSYFFNVALVNKGEYPGFAKITKSVLKIGDEEYPTNFKSTILLSPNENKKVSPIGHINEVGRNKILGNAYRSNTVEIILEISSKSIGDNDFKYVTQTLYQVDVSADIPKLILVEENMK